MYILEPQWQTFLCCSLEPGRP